MKTRQQGFTLVELIVVIVILGILAATALPRFVNLQGDARVSAVQGIAGALRAAGSTVQAKWVVGGSTADSTVTMADNTTVVVTTGATGGWPITGAADTTGITAAMRCESATACQGFTLTQAAATATFVPSGGTAGTCQAVYSSADGSVTVTATLAGCGGN